MKFGPKRGSAGLGDVLLFTSICKYFPMKFTVQLYPEISRFAILFDHIAEVEITDFVNVLPDINNPSSHCSIEKLRNFFGKDADKFNHLPLVLHFNENSQKKALSILEGIKNPIVFNPFCSKRWSHIRNMPQEHIETTIKQFQTQGVTPIGCYHSDNYKKISGIDNQLIDLDLSVYIHLLRIAGQYVGSNTGDMHLAAAVGCKVYCFNPPSQPEFDHKNWLYNHPSITNFIW
jgi:ADP-heptose:LPS heptosyltransferase